MDPQSINFYNRLMKRLDRMDPSSLQTYLLRLVKEKGFFENIFNSVHEGIMVVDNTLKIRFINTAMATLLGITAENTGQPVGKFFRQINWEEMLRQRPEDWGSFSRREMEVFYPEHRYLTFYVLPVSERPDMTQQGLPLLTMIFHDVTETFLANEKHAETQKVKAITQLAAGVAHELGNPLNSLSIHLQLMQRHLAKLAPGTVPDTFAEHLRVASSEVQRLDNIVKHFLNAVRPVPPTMAPIDLHHLLTTAIGFMREEIENKRIQVDLALPDRLPSLFGDGDQLIQAFFNIIKNAIQAMPDGGNLSITCTVEEIYVNVRFTDSGRGITEQELSHILEPYFSTKAGGNGLGLIIVDRIVRAHGGELTIESHTGQGATITISLPRHSRIHRQLPDTNGATAPQSKT